MRILNAVFACLLILFAVVQYNDPDGLFWAAVYGVGVLWCGVAALRSSLYATPAFIIYALSLAATAFGVFWFWPRTPDFWMQDVWWETETAREGMGIMVLLLAMLAAGAVALRARRS